VIHLVSPVMLYVSSGVRNSLQSAVIPEEDQLYTVDYNQQRTVAVSKLDGTQRKTLIGGNGHGLRGIAVDPIARY